LDQSNQEVIVLTKSLKDWSGRSAKLLSKYNRVDPAEVESIKAKLENAKTQLEKLQTEKAAVDATVETLQAQVNANDTDRANLVQRANERGRLAMELKRKYMASEKQLNDIKEKLVEAEKKAQDTTSDNSVSLFTQMYSKRKEI
jgi:nucleoprotein TPR